MFAIYVPSETAPHPRLQHHVYYQENLISQAKTVFYVRAGVLKEVTMKYGLSCFLHLEGRFFYRKMEAPRCAEMVNIDQSTLYRI
jgi:hypothetical protein